MTDSSLAQVEAEGRTLVVAEIGQAHDGSIGILHSLIESAASCGVDAVKFQVHIAEAESSPLEPFRIRFSTVDSTRIDYWRRLELPESEWRGLKQKCEQLNVEFLATPFSNAAVDLLERIGVSRYKIGSGDITNALMLERVAQTGKEVILSTGLCTLEELDQAVNGFRQRSVPFSILQCRSRYPTTAKEVGLNWIKELKSKYKCPTGLSDHSGKIYPGLAAAALGAALVEVHVTFDRRMFGPDSKASLTFDELEKLVEGIHFINDASSGASKGIISQQDKDLRNMFGRALAVNKDLNAGHAIRFSDLEGKKPADAGISAALAQDVVGRVLVRDKKKWEFLSTADLE